MKNLITSSILVFFYLSVQAQNVSDCSTLFLKDGSKINIRFDSIAGESLFYIRCSTTSSELHQIPLQDLQSFKRATTSHEEIMAQLEKQMKAPKGLRKWIFKLKKRRLKRIVKKGIRIRADYRKDGENHFKKGRLQHISQEYVFFKDKSYLPRTSVTKITILNDFGLFGKLIGGAATIIGIGLGIALLFAMIKQAFAAAILFPLFAGGSAGASMSGCLPIIILLAGGGLLYNFAGPKTIDKPFSEKWDIEEVFENQSNNSVSLNKPNV
ncbi:MAG: hypothetical protein MRY78_07725 [Saprospiraceae bacterium]|nr:hypothetical protein [Saprospiraceae bacterium]